VETKKATLGLGTAAALIVGLGLAWAAAIPAYASSCAMQDVTISKTTPGKVRGSATAECSIGGGATEVLRVQVLHNYDLLPDAVVISDTSKKIINSTKGTWTKAVQRCDNSTQAEYYAQGRVDGETGWSFTDNKTIKTCAGTD